MAGVGVFSKYDLVDLRGSLSNPRGSQEPLETQGYKVSIVSLRPIPKTEPERTEYWFDQKGRLSNPHSDLNQAVAQLTQGMRLGEGRSRAVTPPARRVLRPLQPQQIDQLVERYHAGLSVKVVAEEFGVHWCTVVKHLEDRGVARRQPQRKLSDDQVVEIRELYGEGATYRELGRRYGVSGNTVKKAVQGMCGTVKPL